MGLSPLSGVPFEVSSGGPGESDPVSAGDSSGNREEEGSTSGGSAPGSPTSEAATGCRGAWSAPVPGITSGVSGGAGSGPIPVEESESSEVQRE